MALPRPQDLLSLPVVGERVRALSDAIPNARGDAFPEDFIAPVLAPVAPARFYFLFGKVCGGLLLLQL